MKSELLTKESEVQKEALWEMRDCLLISQNSHAAITAILRELENDSNALNASLLEILREEILLMNIVMGRMHTLLPKSSY